MIYHRIHKVGEAEAIFTIVQLMNSLVLNKAKCSRKEGDEMANSVEPNQTALLRAV